MTMDLTVHYLKISMDLTVHYRNINGFDGLYYIYKNSKLNY